MTQYNKRVGSNMYAKKKYELLDSNGKSIGKFNAIRAAQDYKKLLEEATWDTFIIIDLRDVIVK